MLLLCIPESVQNYKLIAIKLILLSKPNNMKTAFLFLLFAALFLTTGYVSAQENQTSRITGQVKNNEDHPAAYATVTLRKATDSSLVKGAITDEKGKYDFQNVSYGRYFVSVSVIGMSKAYSKPFSLNADHANASLPLITIHPNSQLLEGVQVSATKPFIQHKPGQTVVNVENSPVSAGNSVMEVLEKSPGVIVDQNDNISLNGKSGVNVMINGRPTHLSSKQLASVLKGMPAASVSRIELMRQPPAKYSAEGTAGLINIVLKKQVALGLNGSLSAGVGYGQYLKYNAGGSINYKNKHYSLYANYNFDHRKSKFEMDITRDFFEPGSKIVQTTLQQASIMKVDGNNHTAQVGMDFYINPKQTIGFVANGSFNNGNFNSYSPVHFIDPSGNTDSISTSKNNIGYDWNNEGINLHYNWDLDDKGSSLTANVDYNRFYQSMPQSITTNVTDGPGNTLHDPKSRRGEQPNTVNIYAAKIDYTHPLKNNAKLEAGLKYSYVKTDNNSLFEILNKGEWVNDPHNTNHFVYKENVNAAYISLSKKFKKGWSAKAGVRGEQTTTHANQLTTDSLNENNYFELFPNVSLTKALNPNNMLSLSYSRRIDRPSYQSLNPFVYYIDEYTYRVGNPYLKPQFVNAFELSYIFHKRYAATFGYSHTSDIITQVINQIDSTHATFQTQDNLSKLDNLTLTLGIPVKITKWWRTYNSIRVFYNLYNGIYNGYPLDKGITSFMINTHQSFILPHNWKAELSGMYRSKSIMGPMIIKPFGMVSAGIEKSLWNDKASIKLNVQDIFQSMNIKGKIDFGNLRASTHIITHRRAANLTFTWNFGNKKVKVKKYKDTGIQTEKSRIQKGSGQKP